jgi:hypothetical protein
MLTDPVQRQMFPRRDSLISALEGALGEERGLDGVEGLADGEPLVSA